MLCWWAINKYINKLVLNSIKENKDVELYFLITNNYDKIERDIINHYNPPYNDSLRTDKSKISKTNLEINVKKVKLNNEIENNKNKK